MNPSRVPRISSLSFPTSFLDGLQHPPGVDARRLENRPRKGSREMSVEPGAFRVKVCFPTFAGVLTT